MLRSLTATLLIPAALVLALSVSTLAKGASRAPAKQKVLPPKEIYLGLSGVT